MILAGVLALYGELLVMSMIGGSIGQVFMSIPAEAWLALLAVLMVPLVIGGHGAGMRGAGPGPTRFAAAVPAMVATLCFGFLMIRAIMASEFKWDTAGGAIFPGLDANQVALVVEMWVAVIAVGGSTLVALINVGMARQGVAQAGYICGMVGVLALIVAAITGTIMLGIEMSRAQGQMGFTIGDGMGGFGIMSHALIPRLAGIALLLSGYASVWLGDRRWRWG